jgi:hypothetical protein
VKRMKKSKPTLRATSQRKELPEPVASADAVADSDANNTDANTKGTGTASSRKPKRTRDAYDNIIAVSTEKVPVPIKKSKKKLKGTGRSLPVGGDDETPCDIPEVLVTRNVIFSENNMYYSIRAMMCKYHIIILGNDCDVDSLWRSLLLDPALLVARQVQKEACSDQTRCERCLAALQSQWDKFRLSLKEQLGSEPFRDLLLPTRAAKDYANAVCHLASLEKQRALDFARKLFNFPVSADQINIPEEVSTQRYYVVM